LNRPRIIRVGTRGSSLALHQTEGVIKQLTTFHPDQEFTINILKTQGDLSADAALSSLDRGIFVKEIEKALLEKRIDMAVHSLKDLPTILPKELKIGAVCRRADARDALINRWGCTVQELPTKARIGTSSPRRFAQLKSIRPDVEIVAMRGNIDTRLQKADGNEYDGAILAVAGLSRLGLQARISEFLSLEIFVPAPGQGALAIETRRDDHFTCVLLEPIDHGHTRCSVTAERAFLESLGGGCQTPMGAYARVDSDILTLTAFLSSNDGDTIYTTTTRGEPNDAYGLALSTRQNLIDKGAGPLMGI